LGIKILFYSIILSSLIIADEFKIVVLLHFRPIPPFLLMFAIANPLRRSSVIVDRKNNFKRFDVENVVPGVNNNGKSNRLLTKIEYFMEKKSPCLLIIITVKT